MGVALVATLAVTAGCGASVNGDASAPAVQRVSRLVLLPSGKPLSWRLPPNWSVSMRVWFPVVQSTLRVGFGSAAVMVFDGSHVWHRVQLTRRGLVVDGHASGTSMLSASRMTLEALHGPLDIRSLMIRRNKG